MTHHDYARKLEELDRLLNDPDVPLDPSRVWSLLADVAGRDAPSVTRADGRGGAAVASVPGGTAD